MKWDFLLYISVSTIPVGFNIPSRPSNAPQPTSPTFSCFTRPQQASFPGCLRWLLTTVPVHSQTAKRKQRVDTSSQSQKETIANKVIKDAGPLELNGLTAMFSSTVSPERLPKADASANEKQLKLSALLPENPVATWSIARSAAADKPNLLSGLTLKTPDKREPGAGVYGYASFKGLEKLPYDLTLTGKPDGKPRAVTEKDSQRFSQTLATIYVNPPEGIRPDEEQVAVTWDQDVSVTCAPVPPEQPQSPAHANNSFKRAVPGIRPAIFRPLMAVNAVKRSVTT